jgi:Mg-chelatase subunit ChlD
MEDNKIIPINKPKPYGVKPVGLAARKAAAEAKGEYKIPTSDLPAKDAQYRIGIVFDDSGSMYGHKIKDAHEGTEEFIRNCDPSNTALAVYPMNAASGAQQYSLSRKLYDIAQGVKHYSPTGGTPLYETLELLLKAENLSRAIVFSDGSPNWGDASDYKESSIATAIEHSVPVDTVFIGTKNDTEAIAVMQEIAERTGGVFLIFEPGKANFRTAFKYLSPGYRAMLADKSFVAKVESGEIK